MVRHIIYNGDAPAGEEMKPREPGVIAAIAAIICVIIVGALVLNSIIAHPEASGYRYNVRPTFYNLPAIIYSDSSYTEEIVEHISYCTFKYNLTANASHIANAPVDVPIIIDGYSITVQNRQALVDACSKALLNGSVIITLWQNAYSLMHEVAEVSYGNAGFGLTEEDRDKVLSIGLWNGAHGGGGSVYIESGVIDENGPSMNTLTQDYDWCVRKVYDQPYHPLLYP